MQQDMSWTILPTRMKQGRSGCAAVVDYNRDIVVTGGDNFTDGFLNIYLKQALTSAAHCTV